MRKNRPIIPPAPYLKAASALLAQLYSRTKEMMESGNVGYQPFSEMHRELVASVIPVAFPKTTKKQLARIAIEVPFVNYLRPREAVETRQIAETLFEEIPPRIPTKTIERPRRKARRAGML